MTVGRLVPNKRIDEVLRTFACYERTCAPGSRLAIVGGDEGFEAYGKACRRLASALRIHDPFLGSIDEDQKQELLARASAYLVCSEHEGFCVPLVEAMRHDLPDRRAGVRRGARDARRRAASRPPRRRARPSWPSCSHLAVTDPRAGRRDGGRTRRAPRRAGARGRRRPAARAGRRAAVKRVAFVVPRYGAEIGGGAEEECRRLAELLAADLDVTVLTRARSTTAPGPTTTRPARSRSAAFACCASRCPRAARRGGLRRAVARAYARPDDLELGRRWMRAQGPDVPGIAEHLRAEGDAYDAVCVLPYLYATAPDAIAIAGDRAVLVPLAHDEPPLRLAIFDERVRPARRAGVQHAGGARRRRGALRRRRPAAVHDPADGRRAAAVRPGAVPGAVRHRAARTCSRSGGSSRRRGRTSCWRGSPSCAGAAPTLRLVLVGRAAHDAARRPATASS